MASMALAKEPASLAPSAKGLAVGPVFYVPREGFVLHDDSHSHFILYLKISLQRILEILLFGTHSLATKHSCSPGISGNLRHLLLLRKRQLVKTPKSEPASC